MSPKRLKDGTIADPRARNPGGDHKPSKRGLSNRECDLLRMLIEAHQPRAVLELGTGDGVAARAIEFQLPDGARFVTVEKDHETWRSSHSRLSLYTMSLLGSWQDADVQRIIEKAGPYDLVLLDAKPDERAGELHYVAGVLHPGALVVMHDTGLGCGAHLAIDSARSFGFDVVNVWTQRGFAIAQRSVGS